MHTAFKRCDSGNTDASRRQSNASYLYNHLETLHPEDNIIQKSDPKTSSKLDQEDLLLRIIEREDGITAPGGAETQDEGNQRMTSGTSESRDGSDLTMDVIGCLPDNTQQVMYIEKTVF